MKPLGLPRYVWVNELSGKVDGGRTRDRREAMKYESRADCLRPHWMHVACPDCGEDNAGDPDDCEYSYSWEECFCASCACANDEAAA